MWPSDYLATQVCPMQLPCHAPTIVVLFLFCRLEYCGLVFCFSALFRCPCPVLLFTGSLLSLFYVLVYDSNGRPCPVLGPTFVACHPPPTVACRRWPLVVFICLRPCLVVIIVMVLCFCLCVPYRREPGSEPLGVVGERG